MQAKIPLKFQVSTSLLRLACELLGRISKLLIFTGQTAIFERLTSTFLDLNATLFLDSSIKLVYKCDKYPYHLLLKAEKLSLVLLIIRHLARGFDRNNGFPLGLIRNKGFEEFTEKLFGLFSIALFHLDREQEDLIKVYCFLREFMGFLCKNNGVTKDNNNNSSYFMPISEIKTMFSDAFPNKPLQKPIKILKILLETHGKLPKSRIFHDFCLFILRNLKSESFPPSSCPYILSNSLYFMRHLLITSSNAPDPTKLLRTHTEFQDLLFKRPRVLSAPLPMELLLQRDPLKIDAIIPQFSKYLIQLCLLSEKGVAVRQEDDTISLVLSQILSHEIAAFQTMKIPLYRIFETMAFPNKLGVILQLVSHIMGRTTGSQKIMEKILGMIIQGFFRNNERDLGFLAIIFSNRILGGTGVEEGVKVAIRVLGKNIEKIMDFRFFARVFEGFEVNLAGVKALEAYLRIAEDFYLKTVRIFEKFGFFEDLNVFSSNFIRLMRDLLMAIMGSIDRELLRLWMDRGRRVFLMNFIQTIDKQKLFGLCRRAFEIIDGFERISGGNLNCLNEILSNLEENREENDVFIQNIVKILREKLFLN